LRDLPSQNSLVASGINNVFTYDLANDFHEELAAEMNVSSIRRGDSIALDSKTLTSDQVGSISAGMPPQVAISPDERFLALGISSGLIHYQPASVREDLPAINFTNMALRTNVALEQSKPKLQETANEHMQKQSPSYASMRGITCITYSLNSELVAMSDDAFRLRVWNTSTGKLLIDHLANAPYLSVALSPDNKRIAGIASNGKKRYLEIFDVQSGKKINTFLLKNSQSTVLIPTARGFLTSNRDDWLTEFIPGESPKLWPPPSSSSNKVSPSTSLMNPSSPIAIVGTTDGRVHWLNINSKLVETSSEEEQGQPNLIVSRNHLTFPATSSMSQSTEHVTFADLSKVGFLNMPPTPDMLLWNPRGEVFSLGTKAEPQLTSAHISQLAASSFRLAPERRSERLIATMLIAGDASSVRPEMELNMGLQTFRFMAQLYDAQTARAAPSLASASSLAGNVTSIWLGNEQVINVYTKGHVKPRQLSMPIALSQYLFVTRDGLRVAAIAQTERDRSELRVWDGKNLKLKFSLVLPFAPESAELSPDGKLLAISHNGRVELIGCDEGRFTRPIVPVKERAQLIPRGTDFLNSFPNTANFVHEYSSVATAFSEDGTLLGVSDMDGTAEIYDTKTFASMQRVASKVVDAESTSPSNWAEGYIKFFGTTMVVGSSDGSVTSVERNGHTRVFNGHIGAAIPILNNVDRGWLATYGWDDHSYRFWNFESQKEILRLTILPSGGWIATSPEGYFDGTSDALRNISFTLGTDRLMLRSRADWFHAGLIEDVLFQNRIFSTKQNDTYHRPSVTGLSISSVKDGIATITAKISTNGMKCRSARAFVNGWPVRSSIDFPEIGSREMRSVEFTIKVESQHDDLEVAAIGESGQLSEFAKARIICEALPKPTLYVLCIGFNGPKENRLNVAESDAVAVQKILSTQQMSSFSRVDSQPLLIGDRATPENIRRQIQIISQSARPQDAFIFYFSGHGGPIVLNSGTASYCIESSPDKGTNDADGGLVSVIQLRDWISTIQARRQLWILDTCYSGSLSKSLNNFIGVELRQIQYDVGIYMLAASKPLPLNRSVNTETFEEADELDRGFLTDSIIKELHGARGKLTVSDLIDRVKLRTDGLYDDGRGASALKPVTVNAQSFVLK
jgi:hypothetical protein